MLLPMPDVSRRFHMDEPPAEAQQRVERELARAVEQRGFRLNTSAPGVVTFTPHLVWWLAIAAFIPSLAWRIFTGQRFVSFEFEPQDTGSDVIVTGRVSAAFAGSLHVLGRPGRWPHTDDDPDWLSATLQPVRSEQDSVPFEDEEEGDLDRITRRARAREQRAARNR